MPDDLYGALNVADPSHPIWGGVKAAGSLMNANGRALRGVLAGKPREALAAAVPFSDQFGLTRPQDETSGRDLSDHYGMTRKGDNSMASHAIGFGTEMVADPNNIAGGIGAFRKAPTIARGAVAAAKSMTGLDLFDALKSGGSAMTRAIRGGEKIPAAVPGSAGAMSHPAGHDGLPDLDDFYRPATSSPAPSPAVEPVGPRSGTQHRPLAVAGEPDPPHWSHSPLGANPPRLLEPYDFYNKQDPVGRAKQKQFQTSLKLNSREDDPWVRAARIANQEGAPVSAMGPDTWARIGFDPDAMAVYYPPDHNIHLNINQQLGPAARMPWRDSDLMDWMNRETHRTGQFSSAHPDSTIHHELGHFYHRDSLGLSDFKSLIREPFAPGQLKAAGQVSQYATTQPVEAVAEIYAGLRGGHSFRATPDVAKLLQELAGTPMLDRMSRAGLLKGVGLTGVAAAGAGSGYVSPDALER